MSHNPFLLETNLAKYFAQLLNISLDDDLSMMDMVEDLNSIENLADFRVFVKEKFNYERFRYLTGYQKFIALVNEYKKENGPKLDEVTQDKADSFAAKLYKKTIDCFDEVNFLIQEGNDIRSKKVSDFIGKAFMKKKDDTFVVDFKSVQVLEKIGKREVLLNLCNHNKVELEEKIKNTVHKLALEKAYPHLAIENKKKNFEGIKTIERLKLGVMNG